ncbi:MAG: hypothetical protein HYZ53_07470 [Planctomycetes bacterium]|nr:hypothetical protein [Planctomycetota bacterium]
MRDDSGAHDENRARLFEEHVQGFRIDESGPDHVTGAWGEPSERRVQGPLVQLLYRDGRRTSLAEWELVGFTFLEGTLRIVTYYEPRESVKRRSPVFRALGEPADEVNALDLGWGLAEGNAHTEAFPFATTEDRFALESEDAYALILTGTDKQGHVQYLALTTFDASEEDEAGEGEGEEDAAEPEEGEPEMEPAVREDAACPACGWNPPIAPLWRCDGCGCEFDTFETRARCPACSKTWETTQCLSCNESSSHAAWWLEEK